MKLYHGALNAKKILEHGFNESVWVTCTLLQPPSGVYKNMRLITIDIPLKDADPYEIKSPVVYRDRGIYRTNE